jgi:hypothetical protein
VRQSYAPHTFAELCLNRVFRVVPDSMLYVSRTIQDPASQRLTWYKPPLTVLVIKKVRDVSVLQPFVQLVKWLIEVSVSDNEM